jgi:hypothetical protein
MFVADTSVRNWYAPEGDNMPSDTRTQGLEQELNTAIEDLRSALQRATDAAGELQRLVPRVTQIGSLFDEIASVISTGRQQLGISGAPGTYARPTLVVPETAAASKSDDPWTQLSDTFNTTTEPTKPSSASLVSFRLEFESKPGPLDLRAVDDAVSEHPSVRDVALLDYDGRKATLKVWIEDSATPAGVHASLSEKAATLFGPDNEVTVTAHEDAA